MKPPSPDELKAWMQRHRSPSKPWRPMMLKDLQFLMNRELERMGLDGNVAVMTLSRYRTGLRTPEPIRAAVLRRIMDKVDAVAGARDGGRNADTNHDDEISDAG